MEATLVRLHDIGIQGFVWQLMSIFSFAKQCPEFDWTVSCLISGCVRASLKGGGGGPVPLLFNLLVDGLAAEVQHTSPGVLLIGSVQSRFLEQLCADG